MLKLRIESGFLSWALPYDCAVLLPCRGFRSGYRRGCYCARCMYAYSAHSADGVSRACYAMLLSRVELDVLSVQYIQLH
jgi:hypothetical protein